MRFLLALLVTPLCFAKPTFNVGVRGSYFENNGEFDNALTYAEFKNNNENYYDHFVFRTNLEFRIFDPFSSDEKAFIDPVNVSTEFLFDKNSFQIGFLRYRFSETFGLQILDVANPRDYSDYFLNDLSWAKRSVFGLNMMSKWDRLSALWMLTLWGNGDRLPYRHSPFDQTQGEFTYVGGVSERAWFADMEFGTQIKYLFNNGLNVSFLAYHHRNRPSLLSLEETSPFVFKAKETSFMVSSLGLSFSHVIQDWVLRGDSLVTFNNPIVGENFKIDREDHYQFLIGLDRTQDDFIVGAQFQRDFTLNRQFYGAKVEYDKFEWWKPSAMLFLSDKNQDQWIQLKSAFVMEDINLSLIWDSIHGTFNAQSFFGRFKKNDRLLMDLSFQF